MGTERQFFWKLLTALNACLVGGTHLFFLFSFSSYILHYFLTALIAKLETFIELSATVTGR
jgi:hypothetical protein